MNAAISSRCQGGSGEVPRITPCVNRDRWSVRSGLKARRCWICGIGNPASRIILNRVAYGSGARCDSTSRKNIGCITRILIRASSARPDLGTSMVSESGSPYSGPTFLGVRRVKRLIHSHLDNSLRDTHLRDHNSICGDGPCRFIVIRIGGIRAAANRSRVVSSHQSAWRTSVWQLFVASLSRSSLACYGR